ncbi:MAG TPA: ArsR family transcriptional regulator, partial [Polyangia bacterium]
AGLVAHQRRDKWVYYRLARQQDADCQRHLKALVASFARQELLRKDVARLLAVRGPGACK